MSTIKNKSVKRHKSSGRKKKKTPRNTPSWLHNLFVLAIIVITSAICYWILIRPYSYRWKPCYGMKKYEVCMPCDYSIHGIDISHYQGCIDWELLKQNQYNDFPIHFIFMKATEGGDYAYSTF